MNNTIGFYPIGRGSFSNGTIVRTASGATYSHRNIKKIKQLLDETFTTGFTIKELMLAANNDGEWKPETKIKVTEVKKAMTQKYGKPFSSKSELIEKRGAISKGLVKRGIQYFPVNGWS